MRAGKRMRRTTPALRLRIWRINYLHDTQTVAAKVLGYSLRHYQRLEYGEAKMPQRVRAFLRRRANRYPQVYDPRRQRREQASA